jgi:alanyl-tRNA synthetase
MSGVTAAVGGRGGGKETSAQGQVADITKLADTIEAAKQVAAKALQQ